MSNLYVIGNCYAENDVYAKDIFKVLTDAGYELAYNSRGKNSVTILKEIEVEEEEPNEG